MKLEHYQAGTFKKQYQYESFSPTNVNQVWTWEDARINTMLEKATKALAELNAFSHIVPNIDLFIEMHMAKEANTSSRIEGTRTQIGEAIMDVEQVAPEKRDDWQEVQNYIKAMNVALEELKNIPLSGRLLRQTHAILMKSVRGERKTPGEFRTSQNWIGGASLQDAVFIPPHHNEINDLMSDLEKFWHNDAIDVPQLIRIAISHYQFETIHPFLDGNGRIGRLLITLFLVDKGFLKKPSLYLSDYFERHKGAYYDALTMVRASNNMIHWVKFFLLAVAETAEKGKAVFESILAIKENLDKKIMLFGRRAETANKFMAILYRKPIVKGSFVAETLGVSQTIANNLIKDFEKQGILKEMTGYKRNRIFVFEEYLNLFSG